jgi:hypothetical protein
VHDGDRRERSFAQRALDDVEGNGLMPVATDYVRFTATGQRDVREPFAEGAVDHGEDRSRRRATDGGFHQSRSGRTRHIYGAGGPENRTQSFLNAGKERLEDSAAMRQHRRQHRLKHFAAHLGRPGKEKRAEVGHDALPGEFRMKEQRI